MINLDPKPSYFGKCYACKKKEEIVTCISWVSQKDIHGSFRNFCGPCENSFGVGVNRAVNVKKLFKGKADFSKYHKCSKCKMYYKKSNDFSSICLVCYGRGKNHGSN